MDKKMADLVLLAQQGEVNAFGELYSLFWQELYRFSYYCLSDRQDAEDAVQEAAVDAWSNIGSLKNPNCFKNWFFSILSAKCSKKIRHIMRRRQQLTFDELQNQADTLSPDRDIALSLEIYQHILKLKADDRMIVLLSVVQGYKIHEISSILGINANTVRSRLHRALQKLKNHISYD